MHELFLARAALPAPTVCLGMLLRPYSLAHELWLIREHNALVGVQPSGCPDTLKRELQRELQQALPAAVLICSQTWAQLRTMRGDHLLGLKLWIWNRRTKQSIQKSLRE